MARISDYRKLTSKIEQINEKIKFKNELVELDRRLIKENTQSSIQKYIDKENKNLYVLKFALSNIDEEVNKRLPNAMLKYNVKDYWLRREAIQTWRVSGYSKEATETLNARLNQLNNLKAKKEEELKKLIYSQLGKYVVKTDEERSLKEQELDSAIKASLERIEAFTKLSYEKQDKKLSKLDASHNSIITKLNSKLEELIEQRTKVENESKTLDDGIVLEVNNLTMQFGGLKAVDDLSFKVKKGEIFGLIGPNGAGKTTVFNCITQFYKPTKGTLYFQEKSGNTISLTDYVVHDVIKKGIVRTFQNVEVIKEVSVLENLLIAAHTKYHANLVDQFLHLPILKKEELAIKERALEVLDFMGLSMYKDWIAMALPYGILKKVEIARTLMNDPQLIILDEPAAGLNDTETAELTKLIRKIQEKYHCTILLVEHDMGLVMDICDTICAISFGKLLAIGTPSEIQANKDVPAAYLGASEEE